MLFEKILLINTQTRYQGELAVAAQAVIEIGEEVLEMKLSTLVTMTVIKTAVMGLTKKMVKMKHFHGKVANNI